MYKIKKIFKVPTGHRLSKHEGDCKNFHGHNLKIEVVLISDALNSNDMVLDFKILSDIMKPVLKTLDHACLLNSLDKSSLDFVLAQNMKVFVFPNSDPTAETIAKSIFDHLSIQLEKEEHIEVLEVTVWENDDNAAVYYNPEPSRFS
jgi:6-pyruvoyltetrahydropterin/6-carboxytetrahydropterin synthase